MDNYETGIYTDNPDDTLRYMKSAEVVEVVRCKDCRFHEQEQPGMVYCPAVVGGWIDEDWFCKDGKRRSE